MKTIEYRVRPVTRYVVTRYESEVHENGAESCGSCQTKGEFDNHEIAYQVGYALAKDEADRIGLPPGDMCMIFPEYAGATPLAQSLPA